MRTLRSVREFLPIEVDDEYVDYILQHAVQAGSAKNRQPWRFVVIRDRERARAIGDSYRRGWVVLSEWVAQANDPFSRSSAHERQVREGWALAALLDDVPVIVVPCFVPSERNRGDFFGGASIFPALQSMPLAARSVGLGGTLTTIQTVDAAGSTDLTGELRRLLGIPVHVIPAAVIPLGWPARPFTPVRRVPAQKVTFAEPWGTAWSTLEVGEHPAPRTDACLVRANMSSRTAVGDRSLNLGVAP